MPNPSNAALTAADVMTRDPLCCDLKSPVLDAVRIFRTADCGAVPVLDQGRVVGVLTDRDVTLALPDHDDLPSVPIGEIVAPGVVSVGPGVLLDAVVARFADRGVRRILVMDDQGRLLGIIGWADVARHVPDQRVGHAVSRTVEKP